MNGNKHFKKNDATETGVAVLTLYRHYFSDKELYSIKTAKCLQ